MKLFDFQTVEFTAPVGAGKKADCLFEILRHQGRNSKQNNVTLGLMQLMPGTASDMGVSDPTAVQQNIEGGVKYLAMLLQQYKGNITLATAAYNAGPANVDKYGGVPPFEETQTYVRRVKLLHNRYRGAG